MKRWGSQSWVAMPTSKLCALHRTALLVQGLIQPQWHQPKRFKFQGCSVRASADSNHIPCVVVLKSFRNPSSNILGEVGVLEKKDWLQSASPCFPPYPQSYFIPTKLVSLKPVPLPGAGRGLKSFVQEIGHGVHNSGHGPHHKRLSFLTGISWHVLTFS